MARRAATPESNQKREYEALSRPDEERVRLAPLSFRDALRGLLATKPRTQENGAGSDNEQDD